MQRYGDRAPAYVAIGLEPEVLTPSMSLKAALLKFADGRVLPVIEDGQLLGFITPQSVQQRIWLEQKMKVSQPPTPDEKRDLV